MERGDSEDIGTCTDIINDRPQMRYKKRKEKEKFMN